MGDRPGIQFDSVIHCGLQFRCVIAYNGTNSAVLIAPRSNHPLGVGALCVDNSLHFERIYVLGGGGGKAIGLNIDASVGSVQRNRITITEIEGTPTPTTSAMSRGVCIRGGAHAWANDIGVAALLHPLLAGFDVEGGIGNRFSGHVAPYGPDGVAVKVASSHNVFDLDIGGSIFPFNVGIHVLKGARDNKFLLRRNEAKRPFVNDADGSNRLL